MISAPSDPDTGQTTRRSGAQPASPNVPCPPWAPRGQQSWWNVDGAYRQGCTHISSPDTGPVQMEPERSPPALARLLPALQMAGEAEEGQGGVGEAHASAQTACSLELGPAWEGPRRAPPPHRSSSRLHPASPLFPPVPQFTRMGRREESWHSWGAQLTPMELLVERWPKPLLADGKTEAQRGTVPCLRPR